MLISDGLTAELHVLAALITGSANDETRRRLASQLVSRLMVVYFIQKKGLLDGNQEYLRHKLNQCRQIGEQDSFVAFLEMLCFDGLSTPEPNRSPETRLRLGNVPFLHTEVFGKPSSEALYCQPIQIPDAIFERLFEFFDQYEWQMDGDWSDSPWVVTPDVLGWLLEQRINQKQLGAYFTRDDTTCYISQNTIIPLLFEQVQTEFPTAFEPHGQLWHLLSSHPDRYIYPAIKKGVYLSVPEPVAAGIDDPSLRTQWNEPALADY
ncbi:MAG TPA: SAM-dependent methyltransferase, partial [Acidobacteriota bacterium]|nr:SAM-dependent methyltransferase [Acidobacteriota bacterium]